ncbi:ATP-binding protein [Actinotignum urinale]|uniref:ATP-binding protein n=1 Tax=Actinotignum urinale TaxID=190146 RepID=UPI002A80316D|nr:ATP-binding protein [Actinotignum urinale]
MKSSSRLIPRNHYMRQALLFRDTDLVKVVTGLRRCGKSSLLALVRQHIEKNPAPHTGTPSFISINLENQTLNIRNANDLHDYISHHVSHSGRTYIFLDEIQKIEGWHDVINSIRVAFNCDIYVTGSNAFLLSSDISTYLSGRYVEIHVRPLAFSEYLDFLGLRRAGNGLSGDILLDSRDTPVLLQDIFAQFMRYGGMPAIARNDITQEIHRLYFDSLYETVVIRDIVNRERHATKHLPAQPQMLRKLCAYLADNIGNQTSLNKIANVLASHGEKISQNTVRGYAQALCDAYIFYPVERYDIRGKKILATLPKYYMSDVGFRSFMSGYRESDSGRVLENIVYGQLCFEGWSVHVGKNYGTEVDFIAVKDGKIRYVQVADQLFDTTTMERELKSLNSIRDNHEKMIVVRQGAYPADIDGIRIVGVGEFFVGADAGK